MSFGGLEILSLTITSSLEVSSHNTVFETFSLAWSRDTMSYMQMTQLPLLLYQQSDEGALCRQVTFSDQLLTSLSVSLAIKRFGQRFAALCQQVSSLLDRTLFACCIPARYTLNFLMAIYPDCKLTVSP